MNVLIGLLAVVCIVWGARGLDRFEGELADDDWTPPMWRRPREDAIFYGRPVLDRSELLELPYSPFISDEDALRALAEIRALPERVAS